MWQYRLSENCWSAREDRSAVLRPRHWVRQVTIGSRLNYIGQGSRQAPYYISEASERSSVGALVLSGTSRLPFTITVWR